MAAQPEIFPEGGLFHGYRILSVLGKGGMGCVYRMERADGTAFAVKVMYRAVSDAHPTCVKRFRREGTFALNLNHPNIITVHDCGLDAETGCNYLVMDYVPGGTLNDRLKREGAFVLPDDAKFIVRAVAQALAATHGFRVVHRDIKPDNIMFGSDGIPKLADFGIARFADEDEAGFVPGAEMIGTPAYMSPEQCRDSSAVDGRTDIFALGVMFWEMLAGFRPTKGLKPDRILADRLALKPIPDVRTVRPDVPPHIAELIAMMTEMQPSNRIPSAKILLQLLDRVDAGKSPRVRIVRAADATTATVSAARVRAAALRKLRAQRRRKIALRGVGGVFALAFLAWGVFLRPKPKPLPLPPAPPPVQPAEPETPAEEPAPAEPAPAETPAPVATETPPAGAEEKIESRSEKVEEPAAKPVSKPVAKKTPPERKPPKPVAKKPAAPVYAEPAVVSEETRGVKDLVFKLNDETEMAFVGCPAGTFRMGAADDDAEGSPQRRHTVTLTRPFWIGRFKVTGRQCQAILPDHTPFLAYEARGAESERAAGAREKGYALQCEDADWPANRSKPKFFEEFFAALTAKIADRFAEAGVPKGYIVRLATEAEWEYALRAGAADPSDLYGLDKLPWGAATNLFVMQPPVEGGSPMCAAFFPPVKETPGQPYARWHNAWGIYGMCNAREMTMDVVDGTGYRIQDGDLTYPAVATDPLSWTGGRQRIVRMPTPGKLLGKMRASSLTTEIGFRVAIGPDLLYDRVLKLRRDVMRDRFRTPLGETPPEAPKKRPVNVSVGGHRLTLVPCPAGAFRFGDPAETDPESPSFCRTVNIRQPFWMLKCKVSSEVWRSSGGTVRPQAAVKRDAQKIMPINGVAREEVDNFLRAVEQRAKNALPRGAECAGYVVRLPTAAELAFARLAGGTDPADPYVSDEPEPTAAQFPTVAEFKRYIADYEALCGSNNVARAEDPKTVMAPGFRPLPEEKLRKPGQVNAWGLVGLVGNGREAVLPDEPDGAFAMADSGYAREAVARIPDDGGFRFVFAPPAARAVEEVVEKAADETAAP